MNRSNIFHRGSYGGCEFGGVSQCNIARTQWILMVGRGIIHEDSLFRYDFWRFVDVFPLGIEH
jgi:hypothetical protein